MDGALSVLGALAEAGAWLLVSRGRRSVWSTMTPVLVVLGAIALASGSVSASPRVSIGVAAAAGVGVGAALYVATRAFVALVRGWSMFQRQSKRIYIQRGSRSLGSTLLLAAGFIAAGEELFWRGLVQRTISSGVGSRTVGATLSFLAFALVNLPSANLAIVAGSIVGGAVWSALGWWSGGVLASLLCHMTWTAAMIAFPVVRPSPVTG